MSRSGAFTSLRGFSLVEILAVIAIIILLAAFTVPAFNNIASGNKLSHAAQMVTSQVDLARQMALSQNRQIELRFYELPGDGGGIAAYRAMRMVQVRDLKPLDKLQRLPVGVIFAPEESYSTILSAANNNPNSDATEDVQGADLKYKAVRFLPDGTTSLDPAGAGTDRDEWFVSLKFENAAPAEGQPADNWATIHVDALTGRPRVYRP